MTLMYDRKAAAAAAATPPASPTRLAGIRASTPRGEYTTLPILGKVWIELAGESIVNEIESAVFAEMKRLDLAPIPINMQTFESERSKRTLAWAVRSPDDKHEPFGTLEDWDLDIDLLMACAMVYVDVRERLSPLAAQSVTPDVLNDIRLALEKKNPMLLRSVGVVALSNYLLTMGDQPASSPPMPSSHGEL